MINLRNGIKANPIAAISKPIIRYALEYSFIREAIFSSSFSASGL